jgi:hypothetical protein
VECEAFLLKLPIQSLPLCKERNGDNQEDVNLTLRAWTVFVFVVTLSQLQRLRSVHVVHPVGDTVSGSDYVVSNDK